MARVMGEQEDQYWRHVLSGDPMMRRFLQGQSLFGVNPYERASRQPVCPKCERAGFYHGQGMICHHCGHVGAITHKLGKHIKEGHYR